MEVALMWLAVISFAITVLIRWKSKRKKSIALSAALYILAIFLLWRSSHRMPVLSAVVWINDLFEPFSRMTYRLLE